MNIDITKNEVDNVTSLINTAMAKTYSGLSFTDLTVIDGVGIDTVSKSAPNQDYVSNTKVSISGGSDYDGPDGIEYRRIDIHLQHELLGGADSTTHNKSYSEEEINGVCDAIIAKAKLRKESLDIVYDSVTGQDHIKKIKLSAKRGSLLYIGKLEITVTFKVKTLKLDGFKYELNPKP